MPRPVPEVTQGTLGQPREVDWPALELRRTDPCERQPQVDPKADRDTRWHDRVRRRLRLVREGPGAFEDGQDVIGNVLPVKPPRSTRPSRARTLGSRSIDA